MFIDPGHEHAEDAADALDVDRHWPDLNILLTWQPSPIINILRGPKQATLLIVLPILLPPLQTPETPAEIPIIMHSEAMSVSSCY